MAEVRAAVQDQIDYMVALLRKIQSQVEPLAEIKDRLKELGPRVAELERKEQERRVWEQEQRERSEWTEA